MFHIDGCTPEELRNTLTHTVCSSVCMCIDQVQYAQHHCYNDKTFEFHSEAEGLFGFWWLNICTLMWSSCSEKTLAAHVLTVSLQISDSKNSIYENTKVSCLEYEFISQLTLNMTSNKWTKLFWKKFLSWFLVSVVTFQKYRFYHPVRRLAVWRSCGVPREGQPHMNVSITTAKGHEQYKTKCTELKSSKIKSGSNLCFPLTR